MPEQDPFLTANEGYSIAVAGVMNPSIHHPAWYKLIGALSEAELAGSDTASEKPVSSYLVTDPEMISNLPSAATICTPAVSQFTCGPIRVQCTQQAYNIQTYDPLLRPRICEIVSTVFRTLNHTPVSAYGFNFNFHIKTGLPNVGVRLAEVVDSLGFLKEINGDRSAKIGYTLSDGLRVFNISVEQSVRSPDSVFVGINVHNPIVRSAKFKIFDLTPLLRDGLDKAVSDAQLITEGIVSALRVAG